jgi:hypothetical protein
VTTFKHYAPKLLSVGEDELEPGVFELWYKKENFTIVPANSSQPVVHEDLLNMPNSAKGQ